MRTEFIVFVFTDDEHSPGSQNVVFDMCRTRPEGLL